MPSTRVVVFTCSLLLPASSIAVPLPPEKPEMAETTPLPPAKPESAPLPPEKPERAAALPAAPAVSRQACAAMLSSTVEASLAPPLNDPAKGCSVPRVFRLSEAGSASVDLTPAALLTCGMVEAVDGFFTDGLQPLAREHLGSRVTSVAVAASYVCRTRNGVAGARPSEHGRANALDISRFEFADGQVVSVSEHWDDKGGKGDFLREVHEAACGPFTTVIGPDGDRHHQDHFHLDLIARGADGKTTWCR